MFLIGGKLCCRFVFLLTNSNCVKNNCICFCKRLQLNRFDYYQFSNNSSPQPADQQLKFPNSSIRFCIDLCLNIFSCSRFFTRPSRLHRISPAKPNQVSIIKHPESSQLNTSYLSGDFVFLCTGKTRRHTPIPLHNSIQPRAKKRDFSLSDFRLRSFLRFLILCTRNAAAKHVPRTVFRTNVSKSSTVAFCPPCTSF